MGKPPQIWRPTILSRPAMKTSPLATTVPFTTRVKTRQSQLWAVRARPGGNSLSLHGPTACAWHCTIRYSATRGPSRRSFTLFGLGIHAGVTVSYAGRGALLNTPRRRRLTHRNKYYEAVSPCPLLRNGHWEPTFPGIPFFVGLLLTDGLFKANL